MECLHGEHFISVFPAPAGINRKISHPQLVRMCVPRASGDKPPVARVAAGVNLCSPRQRG
ncbi:hypothetical protein AAS81_003964 [Escherichia coli]|nr:hypothetical protein [Escherichia coli]